MRTTLNEQLAAAREEILETHRLVRRQVERCVRCIGAPDDRLLDAIVSGDDPVDEHYLQVEERILALLATQAPVASDLRLVSGILHINIHLERTADLCVNVAKFTHALGDRRPTGEVQSTLARMGTHAGEMLDTAIRSFSAGDLDLALSLPRMDETIDRLYQALFELIARLEDGHAAEAGGRLALIARQFERMGDHAVDIAEQVAFMITGEFREFTDASEQGLV